METQPRIRTYEHNVQLSVKIRTSHYENKPLPREYGAIVTAKLQNWLSDKHKWDVTFICQSQSPDPENLTTIMDSVQIDSAEANDTSAFFIHVNNEQFLKFINTDEFYTHDLP